LALLSRAANSAPSIQFQFAFICLRGTNQPGPRILHTVAAQHRTGVFARPAPPTPIGLRALPGKALRAIAQTHERTLARTVSRYPVLH
jgi:hypothetical protein